MQTKEQIKEIITSKLKNGQNLSAIEAVLYSSGADRNIVDQAINELLPPSSITTTNPSRRRKTPLLFAAVAILLLIAVFAVAASRNQDSPSPDAEDTTLSAFNDENFAMQLPSLWVPGTEYVSGDTDIYIYSPLLDPADKNSSVQMHISVGGNVQYLESYKGRENIETLKEDSYEKAGKSYTYGEFKQTIEGTQTEEYIAIMNLLDQEKPVSVVAKIPAEHWDDYQSVLEESLKSFKVK